MNNFPTRAIAPTNIKEDTGIPLLKEYAWDFDKDEIILDKNGKFIIVEGIEALKVRNYLSLRIYKGRFFIYKNKVGTRLKDLIGKSRSYISSRVQEMIYEAIVDDIYVTDIDNLEIDYVNDKVFVTFDVINIYKNYNEQITI